MSYTRIIEIAVEVFIVCAIVSAGFYLLLKSSDMNKNVADKIAETESNLAESKYTKYNGTVVSGADVINVIRAEGDELQILVALKTSETDTGDTARHYTATGFMNLPSNTTSYINPNAKFDGSVVRNANGVITGITFKQKSYVYAAQPGTGESPGDTGDGGTGGDGTGGGGGNVSGTTDLTGIQDALTDILAAITQLQPGTGGNGGTSPSIDYVAITQPIINQIDILREQLEHINDRVDEVQGDGDHTLSELYAMLVTVEQKVDAGGASGGGNTGGSSGGGVTEGSTEQLTQIKSSLDQITATLKELSDVVNTRILSDPDNPGKTALEDRINELQASLEELHTKVAKLEADVVEIKVNVGGTQ